MFYIVLQPCWSCWPWKRCWILVLTQILPGRSAAALRDYSVTTSQSTFSRMPGPHRALELAEQREINHWLRIQYDSTWFNYIPSIFQSDIEGFWMPWSLGNRKHVWNAPCPSITSLHGRSNGLLGCTCALAATWQDLARHEQMITDDNRCRFFKSFFYQFCTFSKSVQFSSLRISQRPCQDGHERKPMVKALQGSSAWASACWFYVT